jgi:lipooligosaccharide transport system permease protein
MATPLTLRVVESQLLTYRRVWKGSAFSSFLQPALFLVAMGFGLGTLVDRGGQTEIIDGIAYVTYLAPGLLVANAMQTGTFESSFPVMAGMKWIKTYHAMLASPIGASGLMAGHFLWVAIRLSLVALVFGVVAAILGAMSILDALAIVPIAVLVGLAMAGPMTAFTATRTTTEGLTAVFRFGVMPMFLFSGTFFPISQLPDWLEPIAVITPLWHAVEMARRVALGVESTLPAWQHLGYLAALFAIGAYLSQRYFTQKMLP